MATTGARVGERLRAIRRQKGLSLHDVEARSTLEFKASVLGAYERGERAISVPRLLRLAVKGLTEHRSAAIRWYNWLLLPIGMLLQKRLNWTDGLIDLAGVHEIILLCRRQAEPAGHIIDAYPKM